MMKFAVVSALLVYSSTQVQSGTISGFPSFSSGGFDSYGGGSFTGGFSHSAAAAPVPPPLPALPAPSIPDLGSGPDPSLIQSGGDGGDFHGGISIIGGGGAQQGQTLDLTGHAGDHSGKIFGGSFISASVSGKSGSDGSGSDGGHDIDIHSFGSLGGHGEGLGSYSGVSSYDVGHGGGDSGEVTSVLSGGSSYEGGDFGAGGHYGGWH
ncbi:hypothetical protein QE152_g10075 [Popillia japonica]|uniref:Uncharacterized protein n=1 Tax=Popillia japonica TaxID=7064 RepID=A0AAW1LWM2_POPJA